MDAEISADIRRRAEEALDRPSPRGPDLDVRSFPPASPAVPLEELISRGSLLRRVGIDPLGASRSGSYLQADEGQAIASSGTPGLRVSTLSQALESGEADPYYWRAVPVDRDKYTAAAELFGGRVGYFFVAEAGARIERPVQSCFLMTTPGSLQAPHNIIVVEEGAELHVVAGCLTMMGRPGLHAGVSEFYVKRGGRLTYTMIHSWSEETHVRPRTGVIVEEGGEYVSHYVNMTPVASLQTDPVVRLVGEGARAHLSSVIVAPGRSVMDVGGTAVLGAPGTSAEIVSRIVAKDGADVANRALIRAEAPGSRGHVECNGLLLSDDSRIATIPVLDAAVRDVELTHEAAVGKLDEEQIFYLMSRGFHEEEAVGMLVRGFMSVRLEGLPEELSRQIESAISMAAAGL